LHPDLLHFSIFGEPRTIQSYGVLMILGVAAGILLGVRRARAYDLARFDVMAVGLLGFAGGLFGGIALYFGVHLREVIAEPGLLRTPGLVFYGGLAGGALAAWLYCRAYRVPLRAVADVAAPCLALAHAVGRLGCFMGGCCYGREVGPGFPGAVLLHGALRLPVQLYESAALLALALALLGLSRRLRPRPGALFLVYVGGYALLRFTTEWLRGDDLERGLVWPGVLSTSQVIAVLALIGSAVALWRARRPSRS